MNIEKDRVVSIDYTLTDDQGEVMDTSSGKELLTYIHGSGGLIPGLEKELEGKAKGDKLSAVIAPGDAYGVRSEEMVQEIPLKNFKDREQVEVGAQFQVQNDGHVTLATVTKIGESSATVDMNHPLADQTLHFDVEIMEVREATREELNHGHVHGAGGHHH
ncbi:peptidylprolyl isomerase [bacterium]|nr:peptidylprolyl isomerase [bacterium]